MDLQIVEIQEILSLDIKLNHISGFTKTAQLVIGDRVTWLTIAGERTIAVGTEVLTKCNARITFIDI